MEINYKMVGRRIREVRKRKKLSQEKLAELAGISTQYMSQIETAARKLSLRSLASITEVLKVSSDVILYGNERYSSAERRGGEDEFFMDCTEYEKQVLKGVMAGTKQALFLSREIFE